MLLVGLPIMMSPFCGYKNKHVIWAWPITVTHPLGQRDLPKGWLCHPRWTNQIPFYIRILFYMVKLRGRCPLSPGVAKLEWYQLGAAEVMSSQPLGHSLHHREKQRWVGWLTGQETAWRTQRRDLRPQVAVRQVFLVQWTTQLLLRYLLFHLHQSRWVNGWRRQPHGQCHSGSYWGAVRIDLPWVHL